MRGGGRLTPLGPYPMRWVVVGAVMSGSGTGGCMSLAPTRVPSKRGTFPLQWSSYLTHTC